MSHDGNSGESPPASRRRRSRPPQAQERAAEEEAAEDEAAEEEEAAGERLRQLSIGDGDDREHNRMIRSQYRELISTVQRKEAARGALGPRLRRSGMAAGGETCGSVPGNSERSSGCRCAGFGL